MLADLHDELYSKIQCRLYRFRLCLLLKQFLKLASNIQFQAISQHEHQSVDEFLPKLRHFSIDCGFGNRINNRLRYQFVVDLRSDPAVTSRRSFSRTRMEHLRMKRTRKTSMRFQYRRSEVQLK